MTRAEDKEHFCPLKFRRSFRLVLRLLDIALIMETYHSPSFTRVVCAIILCRAGSGNDDDVSKPNLVPASTVPSNLVYDMLLPSKLCPATQRGH